MSASPNHESLIGKQLGDYTLLRMLATGGMARIYEAEDRRLGRMAAVKVLERERLERDATLSKRFEREARSVAALEHPNIIPIYQYGEQDGIYFLAMKLIRGKDLAKEFARLRRIGQLMDVERALHILGQVGSALDFAHEADVIHRDVKPSNILLDDDDRATLTDFGLVMQMKPDDATLGTAFGTPRYISPEQATASNTAVPQSDIYSLGIILFEALTGQTPFDGDSPMQIALAQIDDEPPPPRSLNPDIPTSVEAELLRALEKDPEKRHPNATALINVVRRGYGIAESSTTPMMNEMSPPASTQTADYADDVEDEPSTAHGPDVSISSVSSNRGGIMIAVLVVLVAAVAGVIAMSGVFGADVDAGEDEPLPGVVEAATDVPPATQAPEPATEISAAAADETEPPTITPSPTPNLAHIRLIYNEFGFVMVNRGNYPLAVAPLQFVRGTAGDGDDDFDGSVIRAGTLPANNCARIVQQNRRVTFDDGCPQIVHYESFPSDASKLFWRAEPVNQPTFDVIYNGAVVASCNTVARGGADECEFNWVATGVPDGQ